MRLHLQLLGEDRAGAPLSGSLRYFSEGDEIGLELLEFGDDYLKPRLEGIVRGGIRRIERKRAHQVDVGHPELGGLWRWVRRNGAHAAGGGRRARWRDDRDVVITRPAANEQDNRHDGRGERQRLLAQRTCCPNRGARLPLAREA